MGNYGKKMSKDDTFHTKYTNKWVVLLICILVIFLILKWPTYNTLPIWDESVYIGMGKYLYSSGESGLWESIRPIGLPLLTGFFWKIGGIEWQVYLSQIFSLLFSLGTIFLTYIIARKIYGEASGIIAAALLALSSVFFHHAGLVLTDIISTFFMLLAVYFYISVIAVENGQGLNKANMRSKVKIYSKENILGVSRIGLRFFFIGLASAAALLFRFPHGILIIFFSILILVDIKNKQARFNHLAFFFCGLLIILPFLIFNYSMYSAYTENAFDAIFRPFILGSIHQGNIYQSITGFWDNISYYIVALLLINPLLFLAFFSIRESIYRRDVNNKIRRKDVSRKDVSRKDVKRKDVKRKDVKNIINRTIHKKISNVILRLYILMCIYLVYLTYIANKQERFVLMILPIIIILSSGVIIKYIFDNTSVWKHLRYSIIATLLVIFLIFNIQLMARPYYANGPEAYNTSINIYNYYHDHNAAIILTTDPLFSVYSDSLFIPFYSSIGLDEGKSIYVNDWEKNYDIDAVVYTPSSFPCIKDDVRNYCEEIRTDIYNSLSSRYHLEKEENISGKEYYFFTRNTGNVRE